LVVLDNGHYGATGMQRSHTGAGIDLAGAARSCRFQHVASVSQMDATAEVRALLHAGRGPILVHAQVKTDEQPRIIPSRDGCLIKHRFMQALQQPQQ
jgi:hypothetical protein